MKVRLIVCVLGSVCALMLASAVMAQGAVSGGPPGPGNAGLSGAIPLLAAKAPAGAAQTWIQTNGPYLPGGWASALAAHPSTADLVLAGVGPAVSPGWEEGGMWAPSHIYRTTDGGANWTAVHPVSSSVAALAFTGTVAYAGGMPGVHVSTDSGLNWTHPFTRDQGWFPIVWGLAADPQTPSTAFAAGAVVSGTEQGPLLTRATLHRTTDTGDHWTRVYTYTSGLDALEAFMAALVHPVTPSITLATYNNGLWLPGDQVESVIVRSTSSGDAGTWTSVLSTTDTLFTSLAYNPATPDRIYAAGYHLPYAGGMNLYRSDDAGETWSPVVADGSAGEGLVASGDGSTLFGTSYRSGVVTGTAAGDVWSSGVWPPGPGAPTALTLDTNVSPEKLYVGLEAGGVLTSTDGAQSFDRANNGIEETVIGLNVAAHPEDLDVAFCAPSWCGVAFQTADAGEHWVRVEHVPNMIVFAFEPDHPEVMLGGGCNNCGASLLRSTNGGVDWTDVYTSPYVTGEWPDCGEGNSDIRAVTFAPSNTSSAYAVGMETTGPPTDTLEAVFLRSTDGGLNWERKKTWDMNWPGLYALAVNPKDANEVYVGGGSCDEVGCEAKLLKSINCGLEWSPILTDTQGYYFQSLAIDHWNPDVVYATDGDQRVWRTTDGASNWEIIHQRGWNDLPSGSALALDPWVPSILYVASTQYVIRSEDGGDSFQYFGQLGEVQGVPSLAIANQPNGDLQMLYAGSLGIWRYEQPPAWVTVYLPLTLKQY